MFDKNIPTPKAIQHSIMHINRLHCKAFEAKISEVGIHRSQHMILMYLCRCENTPSQKQIADHFEISPAAVAVSLKKLESGGYINRNCSESDGRYNEIQITDKGKCVVEYSRKSFENIDARAYLGISDDEKKILMSLLCRVEENLRELSGKDECND
ncbi:MAG: MarR family transcriptional regulator [Clostridia bacterium]|nr:MarR family transcriptional regulator [Clostridia bacterium]